MNWLVRFLAHPSVYPFYILALAVGVPYGTAMLTHWLGGLI